MAAPIATYRASSHTRSISLPSRPHSTIVTVEEHLHRLRASETTSSSTPSSICHKLGSLKDLYESVDDLLQLPLTQHALSHERHNKWEEDVLDGSLRLLDVCGTIRDVLLLMKECVQDLESSLRRRRGADAGLANEIANYMISQKKVNKIVGTCLGNLKRMKKQQSLVLLDRDCNLVAIVSILKEVEEISFPVFESLLSSISRPKASGWSLVSKFMPSKRVACEWKEGDINEVEKIDAALNALTSQKFTNVEQVQNVLKPLETLELCIQEVEEGLDCMFRHLIKTRVSLLNILNH